MATVRLTIRPWEEILVAPDEVAVLESQGLLLKDDPGDPGSIPPVPNPAGMPADNSAGGAEDED